MKIALLSFYSGEINRGVETYVHNLANELVGLGNDVFVYQNGPKLKNSIYKTVSIGLKIDWNKKSTEAKYFRIPFIDYWSRIVGKFTKIALKQIEKDVDVVVSNNGSLQSLLCRLWTARNGVGFVIPGQSGPGLDDRWNLWMFPSCFVALTKHQRAWAKSANPFVRSEVIPNGVDLKKFVPAKKSINFDLPKPIILSVGALTAIKRHHLSIEAISKLKKGSLVISGKGELSDELSELGRKLLPGRFKIVDVPHESIVSLYNSADVFSYPTSSWESFGIALLEAMACGVPVVSSDDPIRREIVGRAGIFVDPRDPEDYARAIKEALSKDWKGLQRKQAELFSWKETTRKYEALFVDLIKK